MNEEQPIPCVLIPFPRKDFRYSDEPASLTELMIYDVREDIYRYGGQARAWVVVEERVGGSDIIDYEVVEPGGTDILDDYPGCTLCVLPLDDLLEALRAQQTR